MVDVIIIVCVIDDLLTDMRKEGLLNETFGKG